MSVYEYAGRFKALFRGLDIAHGTGKGQWIKRPPRTEDYVDHLNGVGPGLGIGPLMPDNRVLFAAIDLDEADFEAARTMQKMIPGPSFIERSRSGNAHVWCFFEEPVEAWVAMGVLREVCIAAEKPKIEVFPKNHDFAKVSLGNYINLPYYGHTRPIIASSWEDTSEGWDPMGVEVECEWPLEIFLNDAEAHKNSPRKWRQRAALYQITDPAHHKPSGDSVPFGEQSTLHCCAEYIVANAESNPLQKGGRTDTLFALAKQFSNCSLYSHDETLEYMRYVNRYAEPPVADSELRRMLRNVEAHEYTSTGCDATNVLPYADPDCPIAYPRRKK
jgi:hypothetical protein